MGPIGGLSRDAGDLESPRANNGNPCADAQAGDHQKPTMLTWFDQPHCDVGLASPAARTISPTNPYDPASGVRQRRENQTKSSGHRRRNHVPQGVPARGWPICRAPPTGTVSPIRQHAPSSTPHPSRSPRATDRFMTLEPTLRWRALVLGFNNG